MRRLFVSFFLGLNLSVWSAEITINPTSGYIGTPITISGSSFGETEDINIDFGTTTSIATTTTSNNQFTTSFTVNTQQQGTVVITARGLSSNEVATTTFFLYRVVIEITKSVDKNSAEAGESLEYTIVYRNTGNVTATDVWLYDYFSPNTRYGSHTEIQGAPPACYDSSHIKWCVGTLAANSPQGSVKLIVKLDMPLEYGLFIINKATATANEPFSYSESNEVKTMITSLPHIVGDISVVPNTRVVYNGWKLLFIISYRNIGSATAGTTTIHIDEDKENLMDIVPSEGGVYNPKNSIEWVIGSIPPGASGSVTFTATVVGAPADTITVTGFLQNGFSIGLNLTLSIQSEFSSEWYDWLMFHHNIGRTGYNDRTQDFYPPLEEKWRTLVSGRNDDVRSSPAILDTALYIGGLGNPPHGGYFYRLNTEDGSIVWKYNTGGEIHSSPAISNNGQYVYVGNANGKFYCFSATETTQGSITPIWTFDTNGGEIYSSPVVWKGLVYFTAKRQQTGYIYCLSGINGAPAWIKPVDGQFFYSSPSISEEYSLVYVGDGNGVLYALDVLSGSITWSYDTGLGPLSSSPVYKDDIVYILSEEGKICAISAGSGTLAWEYSLGSSSIKSTPGLADNALFFGADDGYIYSLNLPIIIGTQTGSPTLRWSYRTNGPVLSSPAIAGSVVYVGSKDGYLYGFDIKGGTLTWSWEVGKHMVSSPAITRRMLYVVSDDGNVYCFERKPNLYLSKVASSPGINPQATLTYTLSFKNTDYVASGIYVSDVISPFLGTPSISSISFGSWTYYPDTRTLRWDIGIASSKDYGTLTFDCLVLQNAQGTITNIAYLYSNELPVISASCETEIYIIPKLDFSQSTITSTPKGTVSSGWLIKYEVNYKNKGNGTASGVSLRVSLPDNLIINQIENGTMSNGFIIFNVGMVGAGEEGRRRFSCFVKKPVLSPSLITVSVRITGNNIEDVNISSHLPLDVPLDSESDEWPMLGFNPSHSGYNPKEFIDPEKLGLVGSISIPSQIFGPPIINNNRIYIGGKGSGALYSFDEKGQELWSYPGKICSTPAIANNKIFIATEDGCLVCLNEQGSPIFSLYIGASPSSPAIVNGIVYIASKKAIFGISAFDGTILWSYSDIDGDIYSSPAIANGILYISTHNGNIYIIDAMSGELKGLHKLSSNLYSSIAIDKDIGYFGARDGRLYGIKLEGTRITTILNLNLNSPIDAIPAIYNDTLYIGAENGRLYAIDIKMVGTIATPTSIKWEFLTGKRIKAQCAIANALFLTSEDGWLYALNLETGSILFKYEIGIGRGVSLAQGSVYAVSNNKLWIFGNAPSLQMSILSSSQDFITQGETITYGIRYENKGNKEAIATKVIVYLDVNLQAPFDISGGGTYSDGRITWNLGTISQQASGILTFRSRTFAERKTEISVTGEIMADNSLIYKASIVNTVGLPANLFLTIASSKATATLNEDIIYNISYGNAGDFPAYNVNILANKPQFTTYILNSTFHNQSPISDIQGLSPIFSGISITSLPPLASSSITFKLRVSLNCENGQILPLQGTISAEAHIPKTQTSYVFIEAPVLSGSEGVFPSITKPGNPVSYIISYQNTGSRSSCGFVIKEKLSLDLETISSISKNGIYDPTYRIITWKLGELKPSERGSVTFNAKPKPVLDNGLVIKNNVCFEATNISSFEIPQATLTIESSPNLSYSTKDVIPKAGIGLGSVVRYTIDVVNNGNMDAKDVVIQDKLPISLSVSQLKTRGEVVSGDNSLDIDDISGWLMFDNHIPDGIIEITTNDGKYRSSPINTFNYPTILSLMTEINNDKKAGAKISYDSISDRFTISKENGCIVALYQEGSYPFFSAIRIEPGEYCTGTYADGVITWKVGNIGGYSNKTISFRAQVIDSGTVTNHATITSSNHQTITTNFASIVVDKDPPFLVGRPIEDSSDLLLGYDGIDDDADIDGRFRVLFPVESEPCGLIEYEVQEREGTSSWATIGTAGSSAQYYEIATKTKGLVYSYRIRARNVTGWGNWSNPSDGIKIVDVAKVVLSDKDAIISQDSICVKIPKGAFSGTITFTMTRKEMGIMAFSPQISSILPNSIYELIAIPEEYANGTQPLKPITLILPYTDPDPNNETDDLSYRIYKLIGNKWVLVEGPQVVDPSKNTVQCTLSSLSIYCVGSPIGLSLKDVVIKPNPFKSNKHTRIVFYNLNGKVTISIYNIGGELVFKKEYNGSAWDGLLNEKRLSSGIYFALIDDGKEKVIRRFAIIR